MLLGTHPIPARSPAEREGQNGKEMRREGGRETEEERRRKRRRRDGELVGGQWDSVDGMIGGRRQRKSGDFGRRGVEDDVYSRGREERENGGITCYVNERGGQLRAREIHQQQTMTLGHINIRLRQPKARPHVSGGRRKHRDAVK